MELRQYFSVIRKWLWLIIAVALVAGGASYYATSLQPNLYQATAKIMIGQSFQVERPNPGDMAIATLLGRTYVELVKTSSVLQGVIDELKLKTNVNTLRVNVNAEPIEGTQIIEIRANDTDRVRAANVANELARQLSLQGPAASNQDVQKSREFMQGQLDDLQKKIETAQADIQILEDSLRVTTSAREAADKQFQAEQLRGQVAQWQQQYTSFVNFLTPQTPNSISLLEAAEPPNSPFAPNMMLNVALAVITGILLAVGVAFLIEYLDDTFKSKEDISRVLNVSTLGEIGTLRGTKGDKLVTANEPRSANAEAYRMLRTNISFSSVDTSIQTVLVTSPSQNEGKSLTAANLAVTMAQAGYRTILLDCDLRRPSQQKIFGMSNDSGLTNSLLSHANIQSFVRPTRVENLRLLTTGPLPPNPAELLGSRSMSDLIHNLQAESDIIVLDSPPVLAVADAPILSRVVDGVLLIVDSGQTRRESALRAKEVLDQAGARLLGAVLNRISSGRGYYYYNRRYYTSSEPSQGRSTAATPSSS